jgi:hypothetical protein
MGRLEERGLLLVFREWFPLMGFVSLATSVSDVTFLCVVVAGLPSFGIAPFTGSRGGQSVFQFGSLSLPAALLDIS